MNLSGKAEHKVEKANGVKNNNEQKSENVKDVSGIVFYFLT